MVLVPEVRFGSGGDGLQSSLRTKRNRRSHGTPYGKPGQALHYASLGRKTFPAGLDGVRALSSGPKGLIVPYLNGPTKVVP
jgi:hypothetical protein